jgi:hypothetical protein
MLVVVLLLLPLSLAMDNGEFDHGGGSGGGGSLAAATAAAVVAVDDNWQQKWPETRASTVAWQHAMTKADGRKQRNNQPMMGAVKADIGGGSNGNRDGSNGGGGG